jgi:hypothetical protein
LGLPDLRSNRIEFTTLHINAGTIAIRRRRIELNIAMMECSQFGRVDFRVCLGMKKGKRKRIK